MNKCVLKVCHSKQSFISAHCNICFNPVSEAEGSEDSSEESDEDDDEEEEEEEKEGGDEKQEVVEPEEGPKEATEAATEPPKKSKKGKKLLEREAERKKNRVVIEKPNENDEYAYDSSDEEDIRNTVGNIPLNWYDDYDHIGYDWDGKPIRKPKRGDELDKFLDKMDNPEHGVTVTDPMTGQDVVLSEKDIEAIRRIRSGKVPDSGYNLYEDWIEWFSSEVMETPIRDLPDTKRSFLPSLDEKRIVGKMVHAIKMGWMKPASDKKKDDPGESANFFLSTILPLARTRWVRSTVHFPLTSAVDLPQQHQTC